MRARRERLFQIVATRYRRSCEWWPEYESPIQLRKCILRVNISRFDNKSNIWHFYYIHIRWLNINKLNSRFQGLTIICYIIFYYIHCIDTYLKKPSMFNATNQQYTYVSFIKQTVRDLEVIIYELFIYELFINGKKKCLLVQEIPRLIQTIISNGDSFCHLVTNHQEIAQYLLKSIIIILHKPRVPWIYNLFNTIDFFFFFCYERKRYSKKEKSLQLLMRE